MTSLELKEYLFKLIQDKKIIHSIINPFHFEDLSENIISLKSELKSKNLGQIFFGIRFRTEILNLLIDLEEKKSNILDIILFDADKKVLLEKMFDLNKK